MSVLSALILILLIGGFLCFLAATFRYQAKLDLTPLGLACWILATIIGVFD
jgi:hypothetical protein